MPAIRRERGGQQVVTDNDERVLSVVLSVADGGSFHVGVGRLTVLAEPVGKPPNQVARAW
jgi:hypothetical protein